MDLPTQETRETDLLSRDALTQFRSPDVEEDNFQQGIQQADVGHDDSPTPAYARIQLGVALLLALTRFSIIIIYTSKTCCVVQCVAMLLRQTVQLLFILTVF